MKPRINLAETELPDGSPLVLQEHDGRRYLLVHGQQICGPSTKSAEEELARLACAPFRPARQPAIWFCGAGLGHMIQAVQGELLQKRAKFYVAEPLDQLLSWHENFLPDSPIGKDARITVESDPGPTGLTPHAGTLHAILIHLDASPMGPRNRPWTDEKRWLSAAYEALQPGGLLAIASSRPSANLYRNLQRAGFDVAEYSVPASANAKKPRLHPIWLARKGQPAS
ncbi:hypothetical protein JIN85_05440 [Luteolibacter pohnpeiensis]|uniref:MnmC-like methyltransferase domain-containing protein n=1 Tax=Luteolibacter pohnpeiensis TaxID=454153 RepID=A0A934S3K6_9BACT|nr:hypothetical protein [Luteolibacter pohnpeiensis]MBK1881846.1 hypothetical protein [Luteolibacter pohnpeiensis]